MKFFKLAIYFLLFFGLVACDSDDPEVIPASQYENGFLIANEGPFQSGTGTVSFFDYSTDSVTNNLFQTVNNRPLGNILQSVTIYNKDVFMVVNNAGKVEVAEAETFESTATIDNLGQPRFFLGLDANKGYISQWEDGFGGKLAVVDLNTYDVSSEITTGLGPERMLLNNGQLYVTCSGGFSSDNKVNVINTSTDAVVEDITVGSGPSGIVEDANGKIWVLCRGKFEPFPSSELEVSGSLYRINPANNTVEFTLDFNDFQDRPGNLVIDGNGQNLFYTFAGGVYKMSVDATELPSTALFSASLYGLGFDPTSGYLIGSDPGDYNSDGKIIRYNATTGDVIDEHTVGIIPNGGFHFQSN